ncbi:MULTISPECIES: hypothetical protein [Streptomyces violaceusniger group]|uniref:CN hydrolase domain-containing protein n=1 Tax=Streptomyces antimycoticus TaxID=68175 RepID=A0ABD5JHT6_9ACTN|nr:hypothetical protein [Streptomyces violaceusniger]MEE4587316.1 hypothetical protein [Streptomyces sp. DSM 41602]
MVIKISLQARKAAPRDQSPHPLLSRQAALLIQQTAEAGAGVVRCVPDELSEEAAQVRDGEAGLPTGAKRLPSTSRQPDTRHRLKASNEHAEYVKLEPMTQFIAGTAKLFAMDGGVG